MAQRITKAEGMRSQKRIRMSLTSNSRSAGVNELTTARNPTADGFLRKSSGACFFFLSPRRRSGERNEERGVLTERPSSPRPSPPYDGGEGVSGIPSAPGCELSGVGFASGASFVALLAFDLPTVGSTMNH